jgi:hypothetical protein
MTTVTAEVINGLRAGAFVFVHPSVDRQHPRHRELLERDGEWAAGPDQTSSTGDLASDVARQP